MRRALKKANCPSCGEPMAISRGDLGGKVCCPHCRRVVSLELSAETPLAETLPEVMPGTEETHRLLAEVVRQCREKRQLLERTTTELHDLEARADIVRGWLQKQAESDENRRPGLRLQSRLLERLGSLESGRIEIRTSGLLGVNSPGEFFREAFTAAGWEVGMTVLDRPMEPFARLTFVVASGQVTLQTASVWMVLSRLGLHMASVVDHDLPEGRFMLLVPEDLQVVLPEDKIVLAPSVPPLPEAKIIQPPPGSFGVDQPEGRRDRPMPSF